MRRIIFAYAAFLAVAAARADEPVFPDVVAAPAKVPQTLPEREAAIRWLDEHPASWEAPRVAFDVLISASLSDDETVADDMRLRLALDYADSVYGRYLLTVSGPNEHRELLKKAADGRQFTRLFAERFVRAALIGVKTWNAKFLSDSAFLLQCCLAGQIANEQEIVEAGKAYLMRSIDRPSADQKKVRRAAEILFEEGLSDAERSLRLHDIDWQAARRLAEHFDAQVPETERTTPALMEARIERLLEQHEFAEAGPLVEQLVAAHGATAKRRFWLGWCQAIVGDAAAAETLKSVSEEFPEDPWSVPAAHAGAAVADMEAHLDAQATALATVVRQAFHPSVRQVELQCRRDGDEGPPTTVYVKANLDDCAYEITVRRDDAWLIAARSDGKETHVMRDGDPAMHIFAGWNPFQFEVPEFTIDPLKGNFDFNWRFGIGELNARFEELNATARTIGLLRDARPDFVRLVVRHFQKKGWLAAATVERDGKRIYSWLDFVARRPEIHTLDVCVDSENRLLSIEGDEFFFHDIKYGPAGSFRSIPTHWPERPIVRHEQVEPSIAFELMSITIKLWTELWHSSKGSIDYNAN